MYYDLDREAEYLVNETYDRKNLDSSEPAEDVLLYGSLFREFHTVKKRVEGLSVRSLSAAGPQKEKVTDIRDLMKYGDEDFLELAYLEILGRPSDEEGFRSMLKALKNGSRTREEILKSMEVSAEGKKLGAGLTGFSTVSAAEFYALDDREFVRFAYQRILGRQPDPSGMRTRLEKLRTGDMSKREVIEYLLNSPEAENREIEVTGLGGESGNRRLFRALSGIPVLGRGFRWLGNMIRLNRRLRSVIFREVRTEEDLAERAEALTRLSDQRTAALTNAIGTLQQQDQMLLRRTGAAEQQLKDAETRIKNAETSIKDVFLRSDNLEIRADDAEQMLAGLAAGNAALQQQLTEMAVRIENLEKGVRSLSGYVEQIGENVRALNSTSEGYGHQLQELKDGDHRILPLLQVEVSNIKAQLRAMEKGIRREAAIPGAESTDIPASDISTQRQSDPYGSIDYFDFENHFRGSRDEIKKVQEIYLPYFEGRKKVLDLGCGRGEFTEMLVERGIGVTGVDMYPPYVEYMRMLGLPAVLGDAIAYLERQESVDGIFVGQVVEHISVEQIIKLCRLAFEKLEEGGYLIMETPNPTSLAIFAGAFYLDPSHNKPVHPLTLQYIAEKAGFTSVEILYTDSSRVPCSIPRLKEGSEEFRDFNAAMERVSNLLYGSQDYAVIARKQTVSDGH